MMETMERNWSATVADDQRKPRISVFGILSDTVRVYKASREDKDLPSQIFRKRKKGNLENLHKCRAGHHNDLF